eukprot:gnl/Ergobibamus_cyprinoides/670.p2 GENE.gnl/Ergobibamus_cyprinoides/670~~gnl/Ergobibamus_cyprinoides/670.p2  ORF type:complete len:141 (+),score=17.62 gnl/Ergobibamus_cyprinoides/670:1007-1429(+)
MYSPMMAHPGMAPPQPGQEFAQAHMQPQDAPAREMPQFRPDAFYPSYPMNPAPMRREQDGPQSAPQAAFEAAQAPQPFRPQHPYAPSVMPPTQAPLLRPGQPFNPTQSSMPMPGSMPYMPFSAPTASFPPAFGAVPEPPG